jgi:hypothetical protein
LAHLAYIIVDRDALARRADCARGITSQWPRIRQSRNPHSGLFRKIHPSGMTRPSDSQSTRTRDGWLGRASAPMKTVAYLFLSRDQRGSGRKCPPTIDARFEMRWQIISTLPTGAGASYRIGSRPRCSHESPSRILRTAVAVTLNRSAISPSERRSLQSSHIASTTSLVNWALGLSSPAW